MYEKVNQNYIICCLFCIDFIMSKVNKQNTGKNCIQVNLGFDHKALTFKRSSIYNIIYNCKTYLK